MKKTYLCGCSFTDLFKHTQQSVHFLNKNISYEFLSQESSSNSDILNQLKQVEPNSNVVLQWSSLTRPMDSNFHRLKTSENPLFDLLEDWYLVLDESQKVIEQRNLTTIQFFGWAQWKDDELNDYHRDKLNSYGLYWFYCPKMWDIIGTSCFQIHNPLDWTLQTKHNEKKYLWDDITWGGMSEWVRRNVEEEKRWMGHHNNNPHFDEHPSHHSADRFLKEWLYPKMEKHFELD